MDLRTGGQIDEWGGKENRVRELQWLPNWPLQADMGVTQCHQLRNGRSKGQRSGGSPQLTNFGNDHRFISKESVVIGF